MTSDLECNRDPRSDAGKEYLARWMPWPETLNEEAPITGWATEAKSKRDGDGVTDDENWKGYSNEPGPAEH
jgi:hypothetical protein